MKNRFLPAVLFVTLFVQACREPVTPERPFLQMVVEKRYTPIDSVTVFSTYNKSGRLTAEKLTDNRINFTVINDLKDIPNGYNHTGNVRLLRYNADGKTITDKRLVLSSPSYVLADETDSSIYEGGRLLKQELRDYRFVGDGTMWTNFPLWVTKRTVDADTQGRILTERDSVYLTHDIPAGSLVLQPALPRFVYANRVMYQYNEQGDVSRRTAESDRDAKGVVRYSNGGSAFGISQPRRFLPGITTYTYDYRPDGLLQRKTAIFNDGKTSVIYSSTFDYTYSSN